MDKHLHSLSKEKAGVSICNLYLGGASARHQSVRLATGINWLRFWEAVRNRVPYWSRTAQSFFKLLTSPVFEDRVCLKCSQAIPTESTYIEHLVDSHNINVHLDNLISELNVNSATEFSTQTFHSMKIIVSGHTACDSFKTLLFIVHSYYMHCLYHNICLDIGGKYMKPLNL